MIPTWKLDAVQMLALGCVGVALGTWLKRQFTVLDRLCIPTSIAGGMVFALLGLALRDRVVNFDPDPTLRDLLTIAFMTTIGLNARWQLLRRGGVPLIILLALASAGAVAQNLLGIGLAKLLSLNPLVGILAGSVPLTGGPATAVAFGATFEKMGVEGATELALASATFGIAVAGLVGGYIGGRLIRRRGLRPDSAPLPAGAGRPADPGDTGTLMTAAVVIGVAMGVGNLIGIGFSRLHILLPAYIGSMIAAAAFRNLNDRLGWVRISQAAVDQYAVIALNLFIVMAVLTLQLWKLAHLALPLVIILVAQLVLCWLMCVTACFWVMGRDYEGAVMSSGFAGFMLGVTANAVACMEELVEKFGPAPRAFLVVPIVGAFLVDFTNALIITVMANFVR